MKKQMDTPLAQPAEIELDQLVVAPRPRLDGLVLGRLVGFTDEGAPLVQFSGNPAVTPVVARIATTAAGQEGDQIALMFEDGDPARPISLGVIRESFGPSDSNRQQRLDAAGKPALHFDRSEERLEISAEREIVLRVGRASITLTEAGKVLIRGAYVLSRSSGVNRIKGGSVELN